MDKSTVNDDSFELVNKDTLEKINLSYEFLDDKTVKLKPKTTIKCGETYLLIVNNNIKDIHGKSLRQGVLTEIYAKN